MPEVKCSCGAMTNTAVCEHLMKFDDSNRATECYAKWVDGKWQRGCAYKKADSFMKQFADNLINGKK